MNIHIYKFPCPAGSWWVAEYLGVTMTSPSHLATQQQILTGLYRQNAFSLIHYWSLESDPPLVCVFLQGGLGQWQSTWGAFRTPRQGGRLLSQRLAPGSSSMAHATQCQFRRWWQWHYSHSCSWKNVILKISLLCKSCSAAKSIILMNTTRCLNWTKMSHVHVWQLEHLILKYHKPGHTFSDKYVLLKPDGLVPPCNSECSERNSYSCCLYTHRGHEKIIFHFPVHDCVDTVWVE